MTAIADLEINQGEDYAIQIIWTTDLNEGYEVVHPMRMQARYTSGQVAFECASIDQSQEQPEGTSPTLVYSTEGGVIQVIVPSSVTNTLTPGPLFYDIYTTYRSYSSSYITGQQEIVLRQYKILAGKILVQGRVTKYL